mmetsp:Transcript_57978/g.149820  ORF Transcript_57978/g.149820 Transcript_57978/m.149820 type:complete len:414 (+) Transcript_57978:149-1390(+)
MKISELKVCHRACPSRKYQLASGCDQRGGMRHALLMLTKLRALPNSIHGRVRWVRRQVLLVLLVRLRLAPAAHPSNAEEDDGGDKETADALGEGRGVGADLVSEGLQLVEQRLELLDQGLELVVQGPELLEQGLEVVEQWVAVLPEADRRRHGHLAANRPTSEDHGALLDAQSVDAAGDLHEAALVPIRAPRILHPPKRCATIGAVACGNHGVATDNVPPNPRLVDVWAVVVLKALSHVNGDEERIARHQGVHHLMLARDLVEAVEDPARLRELRCTTGPAAVPPREGIATRAFHREVTLRVAAAAQIWSVMLARDARLHGLPRSKCVAAVAPHALRIASHQALDRDLVTLIDAGHGMLVRARDAEVVHHRGGRGESPTTSTRALIPDNVLAKAGEALRIERAEAHGGRQGLH